MCCINIRSLKALNREESHKKLRSILSNTPSIAILTESHLTAHKWEVFLGRFRYELSNYSGHLIPNGRRGVVVLVNKNQVKVTNTEEINDNVLKVSVEVNDQSIAILATYAPSHGTNVDFFVDLRRTQLNCSETYQIIAGDLNTTLDPQWDRVGYVRDDHWRSREIINDWAEDEDGNCMTDAFRVMNPEQREFTWRNKNLNQQARLDYILVSENLLFALKKCIIIHHPWTISDHSTVLATFQMEEIERGPGSFRAMPGIQYIPAYDAQVRNEINTILLDLSDLPEEEKKAEKLINCQILQLSAKGSPFDLSMEQQEELALLLSNQKTKGELLHHNLEIDKDNTLDYLIKVIANKTKLFQKNFKIEQNDDLREKEKELKWARDYCTPSEILEKENAYNDTLDQICNREALAMSTFRLLHDEKPSRAMINLEKKLTGYSSISKINKPNPLYTPPEGGGDPNPLVNPKALLLSDPKEVRAYLRHFMQEIYLKQEGLLTDQNNLLAFLSSNEDNVVLDTLHQRKLSEIEKESLEGEITREELRNQLFNHMNPHSAPGLDGFTVSWVRHFWSDLEEICYIAINRCYEKGQLTTLLKTAIMKLLRKGDKCKFEATNYRPISLLSVFYKIASGAITRRLEKVIDKVVGRNQKAYSSKKNITSVLLNVINMIHTTTREKRSALMVANDFRKAFDSINHSFIDTCLKTLNFGEGFRKWVQLFFGDRETYLMMNGFMEEKIHLQQGVPQGDILSPLIFLIVVEFLLLKIGYTKTLTGVFFPHGEARAEARADARAEARAEAYADDTTIGITRTTENLRSLVNIINNFSLISGLHANIDKTHVIPIGLITDPAEILCPDLGLNWTSSFKLLGLEIDSKLEKLQVNMEKKIIKVKSLITLWEKRNLTTTGRVAIAKSILLSQLVYPMQVLDLTQENLDEIENILYDYIKGKTKRNWLSKEQIRTPKNKGGLGFFDISKFFYAQKCTLIRRYAKDLTYDTWCDILDDLLGLSRETRGNILEWGDLRFEKFSKKLPPGLKSCFVAMAKYAKMFPNSPETGDNSWICQPLFENSNITLPPFGTILPNKARHVLKSENLGLPPMLNLQVIDLYEGGKKASRETLEQKIRKQFPGYTLRENTYLRLMWTTNFICGHGRKYQNYERVFPATIPLVSHTQPRYTYRCLETQFKAIKRGSKVFRKTLSKHDDFITDKKVEKWKERAKDQSLTKEEIRRLYRYTTSTLLHAPQKDVLLRFLTNKTLLNNQIPKAYPITPEWFTSINCKYCEHHGISVPEDFHHATSSCLVWDRLLATLSTHAKTTNLVLPTPSCWPGIRLATASFSHEPHPAHDETCSLLIVLLFIQVMSERRLESPKTELDVCENVFRQLHTIASKKRPLPLVTYLRETVGLGKLGLLTRPPEIY